MKAKKNHFIKCYYETMFETVRAIIDQHGMIYYSGCSGWSRPHEHSKIVCLPNQIYKKEDRSGSWDFNGWWTTNWRNDVWSWVYGNCKNVDWNVKINRKRR